MPNCLFLLTFCRKVLCFCVYKLHPSGFRVLKIRYHSVSSRGVLGASESRGNINAFIISKKEVFQEVKLQKSIQKWPNDHFLLFFRSFTSWNTSFFEILPSAILPRRHCDAESRMMTTAELVQRLSSQANQEWLLIWLIKIEVKNQSAFAQKVPYVIFDCPQAHSLIVARVATSHFPAPHIHGHMWFNMSSFKTLLRRAF